MPARKDHPGPSVARSTRAVVCAAMIALSGIGLGASALAARSNEPPTRIEPRLIDLNSASAGELELLPRIGPALAARIVADRDANGDFADFSDLQRVSGIGPKTADAVRGWAEIGTPGRPALVEADE